MKCCICPKEIEAEPAGMRVSQRWLPEDYDDSDDKSSRPLTLNGKPVCRECAHNVSHMHKLQAPMLPCPVVNEKNEVIPYGVYPNIDWS